MSVSFETGSMPTLSEHGQSGDEADKPASGPSDSATGAANTAHVVLSPGRRGKRLRDREGAASAILRALATTFLVVGVANLLLLWYPPQLGNASWEFATVGRTLDALPMFAMGVGLYAFGVVTDSRPNLRAAWRAVTGSALLVVAVVLAGAVFATAAPAILSGTPAEAVDGVRRVIIKGTLQLLAYGALFTVIALTLWKRLRTST